MEKYYLASRVVSNKFQSFLALAKKLGVDEHPITRGFQGLLKNGSHLRGKHVWWVFMTHLSTHRQDLLSRVQDCQVFVFLIAHYFLSALIACILLVASWVHLWWIYWKFHFT